MTLTIRPLDAPFGAEVTGFGAAAALPHTLVRDLWDLFDEYSVLVFPGQPVTDAEQVRFTRRFGALEVSSSTLSNGGRISRVSRLSNVDAENRIIPPADKKMLFNAGNQMWHTDSSFKRVPANGSLLSAREVPPEGGETEYANMRLAYAALPTAMRARIDGRIAVHDFNYSRGLVAPNLLNDTMRRLLPPVEQALVRRNPANGRKALYVGAHAREIVDMELEPGRALLRELLAFATQDRFVYRHKWRRHDIVMWDNRCLLHRGRPWDGHNHRRVMHRTTLAGDGPTVWTRRAA